MADDRPEPQIGHELRRIADALEHLVGVGIVVAQSGASAHSKRMLEELMDTIKSDRRGGRVTLINDLLDEAEKR
jgi:hypothetical protein